MRTANDNGSPRFALYTGALRNESRVIWRPFTQHAAAPTPIFIERAEGAYLHARDGQVLFDAISSWWVNTHGHAHARIARTIAKQAQELEQVIFSGFTHAPGEELARRLTRIAPKDLNYVFFSDDGSTAVEVALKMAIAYWKNLGEKRSSLIALEHAYHGDTFGAMSVSARGPFTSPYEDMLFKVERLPFPHPGQESRTLDSLENLLERSPENFAALILEPLVLGVAGMRMYPAKLLKTLREICSKYRVLVIADEVLTGFGRTGTLFACEQAGISPDILCLAKGITGGFLPLGATLATEKVYRGFYSQDRSKTFFHGHSYTGNPIACAAAVANLEIFEEEPVLERIARIAELHARELKRFKGKAQVADTRQLGSIAALELNVEDPGYLSELGPKLYSFYLSRHVLLRPLGNVVYLLPPYCSAEKDLVKAYDAIEQSLALL